MEGFYSKKNYNGVDGLLSRLYGPIIYRCLTSANAAVRRNAVLTLKRAFPIYDPTAPASASEALISKQCSELERLLVDECPAVRAAAHVLTVWHRRDGIVLVRRSVRPRSLWARYRREQPTPDASPPRKPPLARGR